MKLKFVFLITIAGATVSYATSQDQDGNLWRAMPEEFKSTYVAGLVEGFGGGDFFAGSEGVEAAKAYRAAVAKAMGRATVGPVVDGLNEFYSDFRNRGIRVRRAVVVVAAQINGADEEKIRQLTEALRNWDEKFR